MLAWWPMLIIARIDSGVLDIDAEIDDFAAVASAAALDVTAVVAELRGRLAAARGDAEAAASAFEQAVATTGPGRAGARTSAAAPRLRAVPA